MIVSENRRKSPETPGEEAGGGGASGNRGRRGWEEKLSVLPPTDPESALPGLSLSFLLRGGKIDLNFMMLSFSKPGERAKRKSGATPSRVGAGRMGIMALG